jgi:hypothetical protein
MPILDFPPSPSVGQIYENSTSGTYRWNGYAWDKVNAFIAPAGIPDGGIIMWSGAIDAVPEGFALCDGNNGTPNLIGRFIVGAGATYAVGATGGSANAVVVSHSHGMGAHTHPVNDPGHSHSSPYPKTGFAGTGGDAIGGESRDPYNWNVNPSGTGITIGAATGDTSSAGEDGTNKNLPPYFALAFIMKVAA